MKAITLHQPWASLVASGVKTIETRSWSTKYRGPLAIHAGGRPFGFASPEAELVRSMSLETYRHLSRSLRGDPELSRNYPLGAVVATCTLVDVVPIIPPEANPFERYPCVQTLLGWGEFQDGWLELYHPTLGNSMDPEGSGRLLPFEAAYGDFSPNRYAWLLADAKPLREPEPARGRQGLWEWNEFIPQDVDA